MTFFALLFCFGAVWTTDGTDSLLAHLDSIAFGNVSINRSGTITLAPRLDARRSLAEAQAWRVAVAGNGDVYCATGNEGRVYRLTRGGTETILDSGATEVLALAAEPTGGVVFGSTPEGDVYRVRAGGVPELACRTGESYIFSLLADSKGHVFCATGPNGRLLRLASGSPRAETVYVAPQAHLTALHWLIPDRELLVGTSPDGIVYRLAFAPGRPRPAASVLYDTPLSEIRAITTDRSGRIIIAANAGSGDGDSARARVYCVRSDGVLQWSWAPSDSVVFALARSGKAAGPDASSLLVATGNPGTVYELDSLGRPSVVCRTAETQVLSMEPTAAGTWLSTGNPAKLYFLNRGRADSGYVTSEAFDCSNPSSFGALAARAAVPAGTSLGIDTRSGNSSTPDSTWSGWSEAGTADAAVVRSPAARFVQWRARLSTSFADRSPELPKPGRAVCPVARAPLDLVC
jgi:hypothetical protein